MNKEIILLGAGGHALVLYEIISRLGLPLKGIVVDQIKNNTREPLKEFILGDEKVLTSLDFSKYLFVNGVGSIGPNSNIRISLYQNIKKLGGTFSSLIHPDARVSSLATIGAGTVVMSGAIIQAGAAVRENCIINTGAIVEHDCLVGSHCHLATGAILSGTVEVEENVHIGSGSSILNNIKISKNIIIGSGSNVVSDLLEAGVYIGNPARKR